MIQVTNHQAICHSPKMYELRQMLYAFFDQDRVKPVMNGNSVNSYYINIDPSKFELFAKKISLQGHRVVKTDLDGISHLYLKSGDSYLITLSDKFILIGNL
jgi:hypothetical protein